MARVAVIDKSPGKVDYKKFFEFEFELFHLCSIPLTKVLKKDVDIEINIEEYDYVVLVGAEPAKHIAKITSVSNIAGTLVDEKFIPIINPAMLIFKPEGKQDFERSIKSLHEYIAGTKKNAVTEGDFKGINTTEGLDDFLSELEYNDPETIAVDTETSSLYPRDGYVLGISISYKPKHGRYILTDILTEEQEKRLQNLFKSRTIVFHNMKFDYKMLNYHFGFKFNPSLVHDTMAEHYILDETEGSHGLKELAIKFTDYGDYDSKLEEYKKEYCRTHGILQEDFTYDLIPFDIISEYAAIDTAVTLELHNKFLPIIEKNKKLNWAYRNLILRGLLFLMRMEEVGIPLSVERIMAAGTYLDEAINEAKQKIYEFKEVKQLEADQGKIFNPQSVIQLRKLLFDYVGLPPTGKLTSTGAISTDAEVLEELSELHPLPAAILQVRKLQKIKSTYVEKILLGLDKDGRIRTNFNLTFTTSGRLSSSGKFNAQQIPRDDPIVKALIKARPGYKIVSQDLTTAEMYYGAVLSGDKNLQKVFSSGGDFHSTIAHTIFKLKCAVEEVKKLYPLERQAAKAVSFGVFYGSGPQKVADTVNKEGGNMTKSEAQGVIDDYFTTFSGLKRWLKERKEFIETNGYTYSFFGRKRRLKNVFSPDKSIAAHEVRSGINAEVQSLASDVNLLAAMDTEEEILERGLDAKIFMLVHDSIVAEVREDQVEEYCEILKRNTQKDRGCSIPDCPIGVEQDIDDDYSFGHFEEKYEFDGVKLSRVLSGD
jgi:DNA polymerase I-like protein with 3'-5' exonuclease and polymerase domains